MTNNEPIVIGSTLVVSGRQLHGENVQLRIGDLNITPDVVTDTEMRVLLAEPPFPTNMLRAGIYGLQVVRKLMLGTPPVPHWGFASDVARFALRPTLIQAQRVKIGSVHYVRVTLNPKVGQTQKVVLFLNEFAPPSDRPARGYSFVAPGRISPTSTDKISIPVTGVRKGKYLVRVQVDGAESPLTSDVSTNAYNGPLVNITLNIP